MSQKGRSSDDLERRIRHWLAGARSVVVAGVGNPLRRDDSVGIHIVRQLKRVLVSEKVHVVECETVPENYLGYIEGFKPSHILLIDAVDAGLEPGGLVLTHPSEIRGLVLSSHNIPLSVFSEYLDRTTGARVALLGIQPERVEFGEDLTARVRDAACAITEILVQVLS